MSGPDDFDAVRADPDPISRGRRATALMSLYQQRATELARLRREAIEQAHAEQDMTYSEIATALGITKGRVTQIRSGAPARERVFFGVGPVSVGVPLREGTDTRMRSYVDVTDLTSQAEAETLLATLSLAAVPVTIAPDQSAPPAGDAIVICGPKSAPVGTDLLASDPALDILKEAGRWWIVVSETGERLGSPLGDSPPTDADLGYLSRRRDGDRVVVHIAGIHSPGSLGVLHYLAGNLASLHRTIADRDFSLVVRSELDGPKITDSAVVSGPHFW
ncbi:sigma factor-like helix-turn-helix DNA-binding protein [Pseudonocardia ammonioxydans]|nr:sigma factor-like helix-turn-helix DNA-binding protein [Pseudonocardia ammonioxydans]